MIRALILTVLAAMSGSLFAGEIGCIYQAGRNAEIMKAGAAQSWQAVKKAMPFAEGDRIKTGPGGFCEILVKDGTFIRVDERSELAASELKLSVSVTDVRGRGNHSVVTLSQRLRGHRSAVSPPAANPQEGVPPRQASVTNRSYIFSFLAGKAMWLAAKFKTAVASKFEVRTPSAVCAVRGTAFTVAVSSQDTAVGLFEGNLAVAAGSESKEITQGSEATVSRGTLAVQTRLSRLMEAENKRYGKLKNRVEELRKKLAERDDFIDSFLAAQDKKISDYEKRKAEKLGKTE